MKKLLMIAGFLALVYSLKAQLPHIPGDSLSWKEKKILILLEALGAVTYTSIGGESDSYNGGLINFEAGLGITIVKFDDRIDLRSGVLYSRQGGKFSENGTYEPGGGNYGGGDGNLRLNYISVPIVARYQLGGGFFAEAGLQPQFLVGAKEKFNGNTNNAKDQVNKIDLGAVGALGYKFGKHVGVCARVVPGLTNINKAPSGYPVKKDHNFLLGIRASYSL